MKSKHTCCGLVVVIAALAVSGCGPSKEEIEAKERARLELEEQALRDAQRANKAITEKNRERFGRKPPEMDLGLPPPPEEKKEDTAQEPQKEP